MSSESTADATCAVPSLTIFVVVADCSVTLADVRVEYTIRTEADEFLAALTVA
ncbi:hypothetical protein RCH23_000121 [Cryobacterium sp. CAN_C3]|uniref:hypothetical protein n=1 Tax=unclassified Cryobacterium TaxID=2649013 RepID=UPI0018CA7105|nr:hypothetical protein [Cryobacterium sp. CAN_C3]MEC5152761.1 hypothetical protein [Cryobacterium sp. CAN_C3]